MQRQTLGFTAYLYGRGAVTAYAGQDERRLPDWFVGGEQEPAGTRIGLHGSSAQGPRFLIPGKRLRRRPTLVPAPTIKSVAHFRSLALSLLFIGIFASPVPGEMPSHGDSGSLITMAAMRFQNLTVAERRLLEYADVSSPHRGEFAVAGTSAQPKDPSNDPARSASWPTQRNIRAELIRWLLVDRTAISRVDPKGISALGARIIGNLDLSHVHAERTIALVRCRLDQVNLDLAEIQSLDLSGSYATSVHADHVVSHSSMFLGWDGTDRGGDFHCSGKVYMPGARVDGELCFGGGRFQHPNVDPEYWRAAERVAIDASNSDVKDDLTVCCDFEAHGAVMLDNTTIGKNLTAIGGRFINPNNVALSAVGLSAANVTFAPGFEHPSEDPEVDGVLDFTTAQVHNNFAVVRAKFRGKSLERHGFIGGGLDVGKGFVWREVTLENGAFLDLRGSHIGGLCDDEKSWPIAGKLLIDGLVYGGFCGEIPTAPIEQTASPTDAASRLNWLRLQPGFFPQPYKQLANWMRENGDDAGAAKVLAAKAAAESEASGGSAEFASISLKRRFLAIISVAFLFVMLLILAGPYFSRHSQNEAGRDRRMSQLLRSAFETYLRRGATQRWVGSARGETDAPRMVRVEATAERVPVGRNPDGSGIFRREGEFWMVTYRGKTFSLKDAKGIAYIAFLLAHPGERIHVHELIARVDGVADPGSAVVAEGSPGVYPTHDLGDAGEALDRHAQADYRHRLRELGEELAETERLNDLGRAENIRRELDFLREELAESVGIGGHARKAAAHAERARGTVRKNIRAVLAKIRKEDASLGRYFATSIKTGYYCAYLPDPESKIFWQL